MRPEAAAKNLVDLLAGRRIPGSDDSMETANGSISSRGHTDWHAGDSTG
jgi:hypothetical protein